MTNLEMCPGISINVVSDNLDTSFRDGGRCLLMRTLRRVPYDDPESSLNYELVLGGLMVRWTLHAVFDPLSTRWFGISTYACLRKVVVYFQYI